MQALLLANVICLTFMGTIGATNFFKAFINNDPVVPAFSFFVFIISVVLIVANTKFMTFL